MFNKLKIGHKLTALFMLMALIVLVSGSFGILSINKFGGKVQDLLRNRAAQEKLVVLMKVALQECRVHLLEAAMISDVEEFELS